MKTPHALLGALSLGLLLSACTQRTASPTPNVISASEAAKIAAAPSPDRRLAPIINAGSKDAIAGQYVVVLRSGTLGNQAGLSSQSSSSLIQTLGLQASGVEIKHIYQQALTGFTAKLSAQNVQALQANPNVKYIEQDQYIYPQQASPAFTQTTDASTWGLDLIDQRGGNFNQRYQYGSTGAGVSVYVIDTGVKVDHPEFEGRAVWGADLSGENRLEDCNPYAVSHGTHVAGLIGSKTFGVAKQARIVALKIFPCSTNVAGSASALTAAIDWAIADNAAKKVINLSLGPTSRTSIPTLDEAIRRADAAGITVVNAAGNTQTGDDACFYASAAMPETLTVGAMGMNGQRYANSQFQSNFGSCVELYAPGENITSTYNTGGTTQMSGTSMSTAYVSGAVARLLSSTNETLTPAQVRERLISSATTGILSNLGTGSHNRFLYLNPLDSNATAPQPINPPLPPSPIVDPIVSPIAPAPSPSPIVSPITPAPSPIVSPITPAPLPTQPTQPSDREGTIPHFIITENAVMGTNKVWTNTFTLSSTSLASGTSFYMPSPGVSNKYVAYSLDGGYFDITLTGPAGTDYDIYLQKFENGAWRDVAYGLSSSSNERIIYDNRGQVGIFRVDVYAYKGSTPSTGGVSGVWSMKPSPNWVRPY